MKSARDAQVMSIVSGFIYPLLAIPALLIGGVAKSTGRFTLVFMFYGKRMDHNGCFLLPDWANGTDYGLNITSAHAKDVLPLTLQYLAPAVCF